MRKTSSKMTQAACSTQRHWLVTMHAVHRLRPEDAAQHVIERDHHRCRNQDAPVAIEGEERERSEDVKVRLDASAGQVDEQRAHQHLRDGNRVAGRG